MGTYSCVYWLYITFADPMLIFFQILMPVSSIGYYRIYAVNVKDKCIWILDPTPGSADKGERMKHYSHTQANRRKYNKSCET
jgi:hypothetical protein